MSEAQGHNNKRQLYRSTIHKLNDSHSRLPCSVLGIVLVSKFDTLFPDFRGLSLAAKAAADRRTLIPTITAA